MFLVRCLGLAMLGLAPLVVAGCGSSGESAEAFPQIEGQTLGPHGGVAVPIEDRGYVELVLEPTGRGEDLQLIAYFLQPDLQSPLDATLNNVNAQVVTPIEDHPLVKFQAQPGPAQASNRFVANEGDFDFDELRGVIQADIDGKRFSTKFSFR